ncbi:hypothetical protein Ahy_B02g060759 [Arachis hypogaea]|uniref:CCHC-type domain-containing protein n=1 Tax=Arachis hypogaea TaxID=3818 RepID=A0A445AJF9_ARAHY|nr:hypothetical protein Ahy_B02g060759 [Arachis hypogaea]
MRLATIIQTIQDKYMANVSVGKAYWARRKAREEVHGRAILQYAKLRDYCAEILRANPGVKPGRPRMVRIREPDENRSQTKYRRTGTSVTCSNCSQYGHNRRHCPNPIVSAPEPAAAASDVATDSAEPGNGAHDAGAAARGRGRGRVAGLGRGRGKGRGTIVTASAPTTAAESSAESDARGRGRGRGVGLSRGKATSFTAAANPPYTPATQATPFIEPLIQPTLQVAPVTQPLPKTKTFGMRRSERLKMGIRKGAAKPAEHIDLTDD